MTSTWLEVSIVSHFLFGYPPFSDFVDISVYCDCALVGCTFLSLLWIGILSSDFDIVDVFVAILLD